MALVLQMLGKRGVVGMLTHLVGASFLIDEQQMSQAVGRPEPDIR